MSLAITPNVNHSAVQSSSRVSTSFPEESRFLKILSVIPLIGEIPDFICSEKLAKRLNDLGKAENLDYRKAEQLIKSKRDYNYAAVARCLLTIAAFVTLIAVGVLTFGAGLGVGLGIAGLLAATIVYADLANKDTKALKQLLIDEQSSINRQRTRDFLVAARLEQERGMA